MLNKKNSIEVKTKKIESFKKNWKGEETEGSSGGQEWCVYTDSVPGFEPVTIRYDRNNYIESVSIEDLEDGWSRRNWKSSVHWSELEVWSDKGWTQINDFIKKPMRKQIYRVETGKGVVHVTEDHSLVRSSGKKVSPKDISKGEKLLHQDFETNKTVLESQTKFVLQSDSYFETDSYIDASNIYRNLCQLGYSPRVEYFEDGYRISKNKLNSNPKQVKSVEPIDYKRDYVYDLETENHHFACGVGSVVVHNTDSVFYPARPMVEKQLPEVDTEDDEDMTDAILEVADEVEDYLNYCYDHFARKLVHIPEDVEHWFDIKQELVARSGVWIQKKRYAQWIINDEGDPVDELDVKGLDIVRSDFPSAFRDFLEEVVVSILKGKDKDEIDNMILDFQEGLKSLELEEIARPMSVKDMSDYETDEFGQRVKGTPAHVMSALNYNDLIEYFDLEDEISPIESGSKIKWVYMRKNKLGFEKMGMKNNDNPEEIMDFIHKHTDYQKLYETSLKSKLESLYEAMNWKFPSENKRQAQKFFSV